MITAAIHIITVLDTSTIARANDPIFFVIRTPTESYMVKDIKTMMSPTHISVCEKTYLK